MVEYIIGVHSIQAALDNKNRKKIKLIATKESVKFLKKADIAVEIVKSVQEEGEKLFKRSGFTFSRIPQNLILLAEPTEIFNPNDIVISEGPIKIVALDGVTDVQNAAAILRTAAFFGVDYLIISRKSNFVITPSFTKVSSGGLEFVKLVRTSNLAKTITTLNSLGVNTVGLAESGDNSVLRSSKQCLVLGSEDEGISFAVNRNLNNHFSLKPVGKISTLNVSVAAAMAMQVFF